jgi:hypothetical protein
LVEIITLSEGSLKITHNVKLQVLLRFDFLYLFEKAFNLLFSNQIEGFALFIFGIDIYTNIYIHELAAHYLLNFTPSKDLLFLCSHALSLDINVLFVLWRIKPERCKEEIVFG